MTVGTLLKIGNAIVRIAGRRSFCFKFIGTFIKKDFYSRSDFLKFNRQKVGMAAQVIADGIVCENDKIEILSVGTDIPYGGIRTMSKKPIQFVLFKLDDPTSAPVPFINDLPK